MKDEFITKVLARMMDKITQEQCSELKTTLYIELQEYELEKRCTEVLDLDTSYIHYLQLFLARKKTEGKSERTIGQYKLHLTAMLQCLNMAVDKITENDLFCYLAKYKKDRGVSNVYLDNIRLVFSSFFTWLNAKGYITKNPTAGLEPIKVEKKIKQPFSDEDLEKLRRICGLERDLALIEFLYSTGVRVSELIALNKDDIDFYGKNVVVYGKGSKERETYLNAASCLHQSVSGQPYRQQRGIVCGHEGTAHEAYSGRGRKDPVQDRKRRRDRKGTPAPLQAHDGNKCLKEGNAAGGSKGTAGAHQAGHDHDLLYCKP